MITRHTEEDKAYKDREYWFKQGFSVGMLLPGDGDEFWTVYVNLLEKEAQNVGRTRG
jgi:hypothetical protein